MKWSKYNFLYQTDNSFFLFNAISNSLLEIDKEAFQIFSSLKEGQEFDYENKEVKNTLCQAKALVENDKDEFYNLKYIYHYSRFSKRNLNLTINPTLHCNFACPYCFEENKPATYMTDEVENAIVKLIREKKDIDFLSITWFGGEPLMAFDRMVSINNKIKELNLSYSADLITNGYLLNERVINELDNLQIKHIQITIDGLKETHNKRRYLKSGVGTFQTIENNIDLLLSKKSDFSLAIRVNVDLSNKEEFIDVCKYFYGKYKQNVHISPGFVSDNEGCNKPTCLMDKKDIADFVIDTYKKYKYAPISLYPNNSFSECAVRNPNYIVIGPEGEIYKCWNDVGNPKMIVGDLLNKHPINNNLLLRYYTAGDPFDDDECRNCFHLPLCGGGCPYLRIKNEYENKKIETCYAKKDYLQEFLKLYCEFKKITDEQNT
jgi:uncharacterized protein